MKSILITAPASGSGKTTLTMGILRTMRNMGLDVCAFKTGPDYIDRAFLEKACKGRTGNLDMHLQGREGLLSAFSMAAADYCVVEGAMGYFDGIYNTHVNSSYDISKELGINSILVYTPKGEMFSAIPKIKGMAEFEASNIKAVIFNNISEKYYEMLKEAVEKHTNLKVLGFLPGVDAAELKSRHLGLVQSIELEDIDSQIEEISKMVSANIDLDGIMKLMTDIRISSETAIRKHDVTVAIAKDKAFSFYYSENLSLLETACDVTYFSPLEDDSLPQCDLLYLGGGYPEVFKEELAKNKAMLKSIKEYSQSGGYTYAECGGFMYLTDSIDGEAMVGIFSGQSKLTNKLQNFGYIDMELKVDCMLGSKGDKMTAHEFHKSVSEVQNDTILEISKTMGKSTWEGGHLYKNTYGGYPHISFLGNLHVLKNILNSIERSKKMKGIIIVGHGSRSQDARAAFHKVVDQLKENMGIEVEGCFMEISAPFIPETIDKMYLKGIKEITVLPYFLFSGIHIKEDIPEILLLEKNKHADLKISMAQPIGYHEALIDILKERACGELSCI